MTTAVDPTELRLALRALTGGGDGEAALASALEASAGRGFLPRYRLPQIFAGLRRRAEAALLSLALLVPTTDGIGYQVQPTTTPERIEAALAEQAREREARRAAREAAAARRGDTSPEALEARREAERARKAANKAAQRARDRGARGAPPSIPAPPVTGPVTAPDPVTPPPMSPASSGDTPPDVTAPVTSSPGSAQPPASDPPSPSQEFNFQGEGGSPGIPREVTPEVTAPGPVTPPAAATPPAPVPSPAPAPPAPPTPPASPAPPALVSVLPTGLEAQLQQVITVWLLAFAQRPVTEEQVGEPDRAVVAQRLREPGGLEHVLLAVQRAARRGSWFWQGDPGRCRLLTICGKRYPELVTEALASGASGRSPLPPASAPLASTSPASSRLGWPAPPAPPAKLPATMPGDSFPGASREDPLSWAGGLWAYEAGEWHLFGADPNATRKSG